MALADLDTRPADVTSVATDLDRPYDVFLWNDPITPMLVVVLVLERIFGYARQKAVDLMLTAHRTGKVVVWSGPRDKAIGYSIQLGTAGLHSTVGKAP
jgi:ATP-dependent Clp protease adaptor protein ClpS